MADDTPQDQAAQPAGDDTVRVQRRQKAMRAAKLRGRGWNYDRIAHELGYADASGAWRAVQRYLRDDTREALKEARELALMKLDMLDDEIWTLYQSTFWAVAHGKVVTHEVAVLDRDGHTVEDPTTGNAMVETVEVEDSAPKLAALKLLLDVLGERNKITDVYAPTKRRVDFVSTGQIEAKIEEMEAEMARREAALEADREDAVQD